MTNNDVNDDDDDNDENDGNSDYNTKGGDNHNDNVSFKGGNSKNYF